MNLMQADGVYIADVTEGEGGALTFGTPKKLCTASEVGVVLTKSPQVVYESGKSVYNRAHIADAKITLTTHTIKRDDLNKLLYGLTAPTEGEGYEIGAESDAPGRVAIGWPVLNADGTYYCVWYYDATATPPDESYKTSNEQGYQFDPKAIEFTAVRRPDTGILKHEKMVANKTAATTFFAAVPVPAAG